MKKIFLIVFSLLIISCGPTEQQIDLAVKNYNQSFVATFDHKKAIQEGCWKSKEVVFAAFKDGKLDISDNSPRKNHLVFLEFKKCIDEMLLEPAYKIQSNETILRCSHRSNIRQPQYILFSITRSEDKKQYGRFRFFSIRGTKPLGGELITSPTVDFDRSKEWTDYGDNKAFYYEKGSYLDKNTVPWISKEMTLKSWLDRETLEFFQERTHNNWGRPRGPFSVRCTVIFKEEFVKLLKIRLIEMYELTIAQSTAQRDKEKKEEVERKEKRIL
tara:strand:- start:121 stop:936 length:816 start_codon:yes stop_codon:yes gene_type:complete